MHSPPVSFCTVCKAGMDENPYFFSVQYRSVFQHTHDALFRKKNGQKKNEKELSANPNPSLEAVATFCLFCNASLSPACPLNQVTLREFKCTTRDLQLLLITF